MRVLFLCHNHPDLQPGGTEVVARTLFRELRDKHGVEGLFLAAVTSAHRQRHPGTVLNAIGPHADELLVWLSHFDRFALSQTDVYGLATLAPLLAELNPDIVHMHHPLLFGLETIDLIRRVIPRARLVFTAHDFFALCPHEGELLTVDDRLCHGPSLDGCQGCFPGVPLADFVLRDLQIRDALSDFDRILVPGEFARGRYLAAGWPAAMVECMPNGIAEVPAVPARVPPDGRRDHFGFFGHINRIKGSRVLLQASRLLEADGVAHRVSLHGSTAYQPEPFVAAFQADLAATRAAVHHGRYAALDLPRLMATTDWVVMPSIWWENAPLVIMEAFRHGRPVICSGIGGMAELVRDGVDGLHFPVNEPGALAETMRRAIETPGLWEQLRGNIRPPRSVAEMAAAHLRLYEDVLNAQARVAA